MDLKLSGKIALITGGSHGIGLATARALAAEGCRVAICARDPDRLQAAVRGLRSHTGEALGIPADVLKLADINRVVRSVIERWGSIHILVNNVGGGGRWGSEIVEETDEQVWIDVYAKNALAAIRFTMRAIPHMRKQRWGRVVTITSIYGREGGGRPWYNMAKAAETSLMKNLALNRALAREGITFNTVAPGSIMIAGTGWESQQKDHPGEFAAMLERDFPLGRLGTPEEVASVVTFLCSEHASLLTGAAVPVDGGASRSF